MYEYRWKYYNDFYVFYEYIIEIIIVEIIVSGINIRVINGIYLKNFLSLYYGV